MRALLLFLLLALPAHAALPPEVQSLQNALTAAQSAHTQLATRVDEQRVKNATALNRQFRLTVLHLRLASWPQGLLTTHAVLTGSPSPVTTLTQTLHRQTAGELASLATSLAQLTTLQQQATSQLAQLTALQAEFSGATSRLSTLERSALKAARTDATTLAAILTQNLSSTTPGNPLPELPKTLTSTGRLPVAGRLEISFNAALPGGGLSQGLTFRAAPGAPVVSIGAGTVLYAGPFRNLGGLVLVRAGNRHVVYGGLGTLAVSAGTDVQPGTPVGTLAEETPARLYLEVRSRGHAIDPTPYLAAR